MPGSQLLSGRVLITGASGGIGQAIVRAFAARGAQIVLSGRRADVLEPLAAEVGAQMAIRDLARHEEVQALAAEAGQPGVVVANAALPASGLITDLSQEEIDRMLEVNLGSVISLTRALVPGMIERRRGHLVYVASLSGRAASPASAIYSATKFGLRGFALGLRQDLAPHGVGVSLVSPGFIREAGMFAEAGVELPRGVGTRSPEDVAAAVLKAVERNRAELDVAPLSLRLGASFAGLAPGLAAELSRRAGSHRTSAEMAAGQANKRS